MLEETCSAIMSVRPQDKASQREHASWGALAQDSIKARDRK